MFTHVSDASRDSTRRERGFVMMKTAFRAWVVVVCVVRITSSLDRTDCVWSRQLDVWVGILVIIDATLVVRGMFFCRTEYVPFQRPIRIETTMGIPMQTVAIPIRTPILITTTTPIRTPTLIPTPTPIRTRTPKTHPIPQIPPDQRLLQSSITPPLWLKNRFKSKTIQTANNSTRIFTVPAAKADSSSKTENVSQSHQPAEPSTWNQAIAPHANQALQSTLNKATSRTVSNESTPTPTATEKTSTHSVSDVKLVSTSKRVTVISPILFVRLLICTAANASVVTKGTFWKVINAFHWLNSPNARHTISRMFVLSAKTDTLLTRLVPVRKLIQHAWHIKWQVGTVLRASLGSGRRMESVLRSKTRLLTAKWWTSSEIVCNAKIGTTWTARL